ncbi:MAG: acyl-CoA thioesterase [Acidobacteriaceae bacterium]|nr:acyl-CoA thioesterase [Acidobacteriaceae bacterium]
MGVVYYANYLVWMEVGRAEYCRSIGFEYREMEANDRILLAVVDAHCRYVAPARYDDEIVVTTSILKANRRMVAFGYEIARHSGDPLATGETTHIFMSPDFKPVKLPPKYFDYFGVVPK